MPNLFNQLRTLLADQSLMWISESEYPIEAVRLPFWAVWGWKKGVYPSIIIRWANENETWKRLHFAFLDKFDEGRKLSSYRRPTGNPSEFQLLIVVRQQWYWVGLRTIVIES